MSYAYIPFCDHLYDHIILIFICEKFIPHFMINKLIILIDKIYIQSSKYLLNKDLLLLLRDNIFLQA